MPLDVLIFDVDGTLTAPRRPVTSEMREALAAASALYPCYAVTGSDRSKLDEQLPQELQHALAGVFTCSGNELHVGGRLAFAREHVFPPELEEFAQAWMAKSAFPLRTGRHVEARTGTLNLSIVGRNASPQQRERFLHHDRAFGERRQLARAIAARFPDHEARVSGQISVDVTPKGWNKGGVANEVLERHPGASLHFFGDNMGEGGNDEPLAKALAAAGSRHRVHPVADWRETLGLLRQRFLSRGVSRVA